MFIVIFAVAVVVVVVDVVVSGLVELTARIPDKREKRKGSSIASSAQPGAL